MRILMPVDGSPFSKAAVDFVASRKTLLKNSTEVELVNIQGPVPLRAARALGKQLVASHYAAEATRVLKPAAARLTRAGACARYSYLIGTVDRELVETVQSDPADLVVMGSHGHTGLTRLLLGSVAGTLAVACAKPLLILRNGGLPRRDSLRIGLTLDGSQHAAAAAQFLATHRDLFGAHPQITLVHVAPELTKVTVPGWIDREVETGIEPSQVQAMHTAAFEAVFVPVHEVLNSAGLQASEARLVGSNAGDEIVAWVDRCKPDLLVMSSSGPGQGGGSAFGPVAARVAARVRTAYLLIRHEPEPRTASMPQPHSKPQTGPSPRPHGRHQATSSMHAATRRQRPPDGVA